MLTCQAALRRVCVLALAATLAACARPSPVGDVAPAAGTVTSAVPTARRTPTSRPATPSPAPSAPPLPTAGPTALPPTTTPAAVAREYRFPVQAEQVSYGRDHHDYPATDIFCPVGSRFVAPTSGVVDFVSRVDRWAAATDRPEERGGLAVAIIGDDGVRYYGSHLSVVAEGIAPGVRVGAGTLLGLTGASGNARSTPPHLHFGISRPTTPDDWQVRRGEVPPYPYLQAWERGEALTPVLP